MIAAIAVAVSDLGRTYLDKRVIEDELQALEDVRDRYRDCHKRNGRQAEFAAGAMSCGWMRLEPGLPAWRKWTTWNSGIDNPPGIGGPKTMLNDGTGRVSDMEFLITLNQLDQALEDREDKLSAMEAMLMGRSLQDQTRPLGNPAKGGWVSSLFGYRTDPISGNREFHLGA